MPLPASPPRLARPAAAGVLAVALLVPCSVHAQAYVAPAPRRQFVTVSLDWLYTHPLHFAEHPLQDLVLADVAPAYFEAYDYRTTDGSVLIDVLEFGRRSRGAGVTVYPFGRSVGPTLGIRASLEDLPRIRVEFAGPAPIGGYALVGARAYDVGAALVMSDRSAGWGLGSHAFVGGGVGRISSDLGEGNRYFAEGGGGLTSGPLGVELSLKFAWNRLSEPLPHRFLTVPVTVRGTVSF